MSNKAAPPAGPTKISAEPAALAAGFLFFILMAAALPVSSWGQAPAPTEAAADTTAQTSNVVFPVLGYTPDTSILGGVTWLHFFSIDHTQDLARPSLFSPLLILTVREQLMIVLGTELYWGQGKHHAVITPQYLKFPDQFFGIGRDTRASDEEDYTPEQFALDLLYEQKALQDLAVGLTYHFEKSRLLEVEPGGWLDRGIVPGTEPTNLSAAGLRLAWDSRDYTWSPTSGSYFQTQVRFFRQDLGSDHHFTEYMADLRHYWRLGQWGSVAGQVMSKVQEGDPPFFTLPRLGGFEGLRGYPVRPLPRPGPPPGPHRVAQPRILERIGLRPFRRDGRCLSQFSPAHHSRRALHLRLGLPLHHQPTGAGEDPLGYGIRERGHGILSWSGGGVLIAGPSQK